MYQPVEYFFMFSDKLTKKSGKTSWKTTHSCNLGVRGARGWFLQIGWQRGQKGVEIEKYLETVGVFLRQIMNSTIIVMYHDWRKFDSCIFEGKYKDLVQY